MRAVLGLLELPGEHRLRRRLAENGFVVKPLSLEIPLDDVDLGGEMDVIVVDMAIPIARDFLSAVSATWPEVSLVAAVPVVAYHHEHWDGTGYPAGLRGEEIVWGARVVALADAYEAMTSDRPYRKALSREHAIEELIGGRGTQFDPTLLDAFLVAVAP